MQYTSETTPIPNVRARALRTAGHHQAVVKCPSCGELHRHLGLGVRRSPCGAVYVVRPPRAVRAAA
jgi:hypothetical protein